MEISYIFPSLSYKLPPPLSISLTRVLHLLQFINLYRYIIITQSHSKSVVHVRSTLGTVCVGKMCNDMYSPKQYFHCLENTQRFACSFLSTTTPGNIDLFTVSIVLSFPEFYIFENYRMQTLLIDFFPLIICP